MAGRALKFGLSEAVCGDLTQVFSRHPEIMRVLVFGSRAKGTFRDGSDIDLAVFAPEMSEERFTQMWMELDALPIIFKMDVLHWDTLSNTRLKDKILHEGREFYSNRNISECA